MIRIIQKLVPTDLRYAVTRSVQTTTPIVEETTVNNTQAPLESIEEDDKLFKSVTVEVRGHEPAVLESYTKFVQFASKELDINLASVETPHHFNERWSILKSKFVKKKHFRQYEMRTHFKVYEFKHLTGSTCDTFLEYIQRNIPEGVSMYVRKNQIIELPDNLRQPPNSTA